MLIGRYNNKSYSPEPHLGAKPRSIPGAYVYG